ncbi:putative membrane protein [Flavobacteriaceae bacterium MAR_2010_72]|nr:putative membrane protein [Flavobacteriaceae bacterium MAR_2010_72]
MSNHAINGNQMAPLLILFVSFLTMLAINKLLLKERFSLSFLGRLALAIMLIFTGMTHFTKTDLMIEMMPEIVPIKLELIYLTGCLEIMASIGLLIHKYSKITSVMLIIFFLSILPANVIGSLKEVALGGMQHGVNYLYFRIPLQLLFVFWAYYFGITKNKTLEKQK